MTTYVILNTTEVKDEDGEVLIDFSQLSNRNADMLRYSKDGSKALVKYKGDQPSFLDGKTTYTHAEIMVVLRDTDGDWHAEAED
tara:strand:- start:1202 stop:1453 length:252 start_codon:yes stop_codon:yes gene_type:complete